MVGSGILKLERDIQREALCAEGGSEIGSSNDMSDGNVDGNLEEYPLEEYSFG